MRAIFRFLTAPFRWIPWYVWIAAIGVAAWFGRQFLLIAATIIAFHPIPVPPLFQGEPASLAEARQQDLQHFQHVRRNERSFDEAGRARFDAAVEAMQPRLGEMSDAEFQLELARIQAIIDNGHSNASATRMVQGFERMPVRTAWLAGELRVLRVLPGHEDLLGARLVAIGDVPAGEAIGRFRDAFGGNDAFFLSFAPLLVETPAYREAVGLDGETADLVFELADGTAITRRLDSQPVDPDASRLFSGDLPMFWRSESDSWVALQPEGDPLYLARPEHDYWMVPLAGLNGAYVSLRANLDDDSGERLADWVVRTTEELRALEPDFVVVDQRFNGGGDLTRTAGLMQALGETVGQDGRIYLLASGNTFSAGIVNLAMAKEAAPSQTRLVGEPIGDRLQFWAEGWWYSLPNSGFRARYSTGYYDLQNGCEGVFICHWGSLHIFPVLVDDLEIDIAAPLDFQAYAAGRDPAMEAVMRREGAGGSVPAEALP